MKQLLQLRTVLLAFSILILLFLMPNAKAQLVDCKVVSIPFTETFATYKSYPSGSIPDCWHRLSNNTSYTGYPRISSTKRYGTTDTVSIYFTVEAGKHNIFISPYIDANISELSVSFYFNSNNVYGKIEVGIMTDTINESSFNLIEEIDYNNVTESWIKHTTLFNSYTGSGKYIAFRWTSTDSRNPGRGYLDQITIEVPSSCMAPSNLKASNVGRKSAVVSWAPSLSNPSKYEVSVFDSENNNVFNEYTEDTQCVLYDLIPGENHTVIVKAICGESNYSAGESMTLKTLAAQNCAVPAFFAVNNIKEYSADLTWFEEGTSEDYHIEYRETGATQWVRTLISENTSIILFTLGNLNDNTEYTVRVRALCINGDSTTWVSQTFRTLCSPITALPFIEHFDNVSNGKMPFCWNVTTANSSVLVSSNPNDYRSKSGALQFKSEQGSTNIVTLPAFDLSNVLLSINDLQIDFWAKKQLAGGDFILGVMDDPTDAASFVAVSTLSFPAAGTWTNFSVPFTSYPGTGKYIAFMWKNAGTNAVLLDDIYLDKATVCAKPTTLSIGSVKSATVYFSWTSSGATQYEAVCALIGTNPDWAKATVFTGNTGSISGLYSETNYNLYLRAICEAPSFAVDVSFKTDCGPVVEAHLPYIETFDKYSTGPSSSMPTCWSRSAGMPYISATHVSAPGSLYFNSAAAVYAATGEFTVNIPDLQASFKLRNENNAYGFVVGVMTDPSDLATFDPVDTIYNNVESAWENCVVYFNNYTGNGKYIAFKSGGFGGTSYVVYLDDLKISKIGNCPAPSQVVTSNVTEGGATISWRENAIATVWNVAYGVSGFSPDDMDAIIFSTSSNPSDLYTLADNTIYDVYISAVCPNGNASAWSILPATFQTTQSPKYLPYQCNFEDDAENYSWVFFNDNQTNQWHIGTATNNGTGSKSLYISSDNGLTHGYNNATSYVYAAKSFLLEETGVHQLAFDWRANGENNRDLMRAFLVPSSVVLQAGLSHGMNGTNNLTPTGWIDIGGGLLYNNNTWKSEVIDFTVSNPGYYNLVFFWKNDQYTANQSPAAVDNISLRMLTCPPPTALTITNIENTAATVSWTEVKDATQWVVQYGERGFNLGGGTTVPASSTSLQLTGLSSNYTAYDVYVKAVCGQDDESYWTGPVSFRTTQSPAPVPYTCDFEDENETWGLINGNQKNQWYIGEADNFSSRALYISNDTGKTNNYTLNATSYVYAVRSLDITEPETYVVEFDWKANGAMHFDVLRAFLVPVSVRLEAGNAFGMTDAYNTVPANWIDVGNGVMYGATIDQHSYSRATINEAGVYNLVFFWKNYSSTYGQQTPAAIDNISVKVLSCPSPRSLTLTDIAPTEATIEWLEIKDATNWEVQYGYAGFIAGRGTSGYAAQNAAYSFTGLEPAKQYDVYVRSICSSNDTSGWSPKLTFKTVCATAITRLPYFENFDSYEQGAPIPTYNKDVIPDCWIVTKSDNVADYPFIASWSSFVYSAPYTFDFGQTPSGHTMAVLPKLDTSIAISNLELSFFSNSEFGTNGTFHVGVIEEPLLESTFTTINSFTNISTVQTQRFVDFSTYTGNGRYIAFKWENGANNKFFMDDMLLAINIMLTPCTQPSSFIASDITDTSARITWIPAGNENIWILEYKLASEEDYLQRVICNTNSYALTGLSESTTYDLRVCAICDGFGHSPWTEIELNTQAVATFTITPEAGANGTIDPSEPVTVKQGDSQTFTFTPDANYRVKQVLLDEDSVGNDNTYTIENIQADMTISVEFEEIIGIDQYLLDNSILIYPNPAKDKLTIKLAIPFEKIEITNLLGQAMYTANVNSSEMSIQVTDYPSGVYFVRLSGDRGEVVKKFVRE